MLRTTTAVTIAFLLTATAAKAEFTMKDIVDDQYKAVAPVYISGLYAGMTWSNNALKQRNESPLFCEPDRVVTNSEVTSILTKFSEWMAATGGKDSVMSFPVGTILLLSLQREFPCTPQTHVQKSPICDMTDIKANSSPNCLRYYFFCKLGTYTPTPKTPLPSTVISNVMRAATARIAINEAEKNCEAFDYSQAYSAYRLLMEGP